MRQHTQYLNPTQTRLREPNDYENLLAGSLERYYASGIHDLEVIVDRLNLDCVPSPDGKPWTADVFKSEMRRLGA